MLWSGEQFWTYSGKKNPPQGFKLVLVCPVVSTPQLTNILKIPNDPIIQDGATRTVPTPLLIFCPG